MKKIKNKFIWVVIVFIIFILWFEIIKYSLLLKIDRNSYVSLMEGEAFLNDINLQIQKKYKLGKWDKLKTIWENSLAIINWWDWSITRVWWNSEIIINNAEVSDNLTSIKIDFELLKWKTWSDVISFVWGESYFYEKFSDTTAAVRWTIYELNLERDYLYVISHEVKIIKNNQTKIIPEKKPFIISEFSFVWLVEFISKIRDKSWEQLNKQLDIEFYTNLLNQLTKANEKTLNFIAKIENDSFENQKKAYEEIKEVYQSLNFVKPDSELFEQKLKLKEILLNISPKEEKNDLLNTSLYDFKDIIKTKQFQYLQDSLKIFNEHLLELRNLDIDFSSYFNKEVLSTIKVPESLIKEFSKSFEQIWKVLDLWDLKIDKNNIGDFLQNQFNKTIDKSLFYKIKNFIINLF